MITTIRTKLLAILLLFVLITVTASFVVFSYFEKNKDALSSITQKTENTHVLLLKDIKITRSFYENETINPAFFKTGKSTLIEEHLKMCGRMDQALNDLYSAQQETDFNLSDQIKALKEEFTAYKYLTDALFKQILVRGFKDYGIEGRMRVFAHDLENYQDEIGLVNILQLRRHEKDFIIRQEDPYVTKHDNLIKRIKDQLLKDRSLTNDRKTIILSLLENYSAQFSRLVTYEKKLGLKSNSGLKKQIDDVSDGIEISLSELVAYSAVKEQAALAAIKSIYFYISLVFVLISILSAVFISKSVSRSITYLKEKIDQFVKSEFTTRTILPINNSVNEIDVLASNFSIMEQHIVNQVSSLKQSNKDLEMLFYATSNDIRFPLIKVKELTDLAFQKTTEPELREYLQQINQSWENLLNIVNELGIITNIRNVEIKTEDIDLEELIRSVFFEFRSIPGFDSIIFSLNLSLKKTFASSPGLIKAVFRNLIENGIKYATKRSSFSFLRISISDQNHDMIRVEIADNGIGIKQEHQAKIFDMFFRGTSFASGTGLGLYIVKCSVEKLHGSIGVESTEGQGTVFRLLIPNNYKPKNIKEQILYNRDLSEIAQGMSLSAV